MKVVGLTRLRVCVVCKTAVYLKITHRNLPVRVMFAQRFYTPPITIYLGKKKRIISINYSEFPAGLRLVLSLPQGLDSVTLETHCVRIFLSPPALSPAVWR